MAVQSWARAGPSRAASTDNAAFGVPDEVGKDGNLRILIAEWCELLQCLFNGQPGTVDGLVRILQSMNRGVGKTAALQAAHVEAIRLGGISMHHQERRDVLE